VLNGSISLQEPILTTLESVQNPLDQAIVQISVFFAVSFLVVMLILSVRLVVKRNLELFTLAISLVFIITLSIPISAYGIEKILGTGPLRDFGSATALARSMAPLATIMIVPHFRDVGKGHFPFKKLFLILGIVCLSLTVVFAPFLFLRKEAKSTYDMLRISGDMSEYTILGNHMYEFVTSYIPIESKIRILSPAAGFLRHYHILPLQYRTGKQIETGAMNISLESKIFDNGIFTVSNSMRHPFTIFLDEQNLTRHW